MFATRNSSSDPSEEDDAFIRDDVSFYRQVDWALDISAGEFQELDIRNVPAALIRRDPETQVVVRRSKLIEMADVWKALQPARSVVLTALSIVVELGLEDYVIVAPKT